MTMPFQLESDRCRDAQRSWCRQSIGDRLRPVAELRFLLVDRRQEITAAVEADVKRPPAEVYATDLVSTAAAAKFLVQSAKKILKPTYPGGNPLWLFDSRDTVYREPHGLVGLIATWNYPVYLTLIPLLQAVVAGNGVLWKPSEQTPRTAKVLEKILKDAGFPSGLIQQLPATREAGPELVEADINFLHFTGSDAVGKKLAARLGERLIPSVLELSGIDAMIVLADANIPLAARSAWYGTTLNHGQTCLATRRVFVHKSRLREFVEQLTPLVKASPPVRLQTEGQATQARNLIANAKQHGAEVMLGQGKNLAASAYADSVPPAVIISPDASLAICQQATFSPLMVVIPFDNPTQAASLHNQCPFGLGGSIFTSNILEGESLAQMLNCGAVVVNDVIVPTAHPATPFGGRGKSGWGATQGGDGLLAMTVPKVVSVRSGTRRPHVDAHLIQDPQLGPMMEGMLIASHSRGLWARIKGFRQLVRAYLKSGKPGEA